MIFLSQDIKTAFAAETTKLKTQAEEAAGLQSHAQTTAARLERERDGARVSERLTMVTALSCWRLQ